MPGNTGTSRTKLELMEIFRDGQPADSITPEDMRDFVESSMDGSCGPGPDGWNNVEDYGAVGDCRRCEDAVMGSGSYILNSATASWESSEFDLPLVGKFIEIGRAHV